MQGLIRVSILVLLAGCGGESGRSNGIYNDPRWDDGRPFDPSPAYASGGSSAVAGGSLGVAASPGSGGSHSTAGGSLGAAASPGSGGSHSTAGGSLGVAASPGFGGSNSTAGGSPGYGASGGSTPIGGSANNPCFGGYAECLRQAASCYDFALPEECESFEEQCQVRLEVCEGARAAQCGQFILPWIPDVDASFETARTFCSDIGSDLTRVEFLEVGVEVECCPRSELSLR